MKESLGTSITLALLLVGISVGVALTSPDSRWQLAQVGSSTSGTSGGGNPTSSSIPVTFAVTVSSDLICDSAGLRRTVGFFTSPVVGGYFSLYGAGGVDYGDRQPSLYDLPAGIYTWEGRESSGYVRTGTYAGSFTIGGTCPATGTNTTSTTGTLLPTTTPLTTPPPPPSTATPSPLLPVSVGVRTGSACVAEKNMTQVAVEIDPPGAARVVFTKDNGNAITTSPQGVLYLPNGLYSWRVEPNAGYRVATESSGAFSLAYCPTHIRVSVTPGTTCDLIDEGVPITFSLLPNITANFTVKNVNTGESIPVRPGVEYFPNGTYRWELLPPSGMPLSVEGPSSGNFSVTSCTAAANAPFVPPEPGTILVFREGKLVEPVVRQGENVAIRVDSSLATALTLELVARDARKTLGQMMREGTSDRWLFAWRIGDVLPGEYTIVARGKHKTQGEYTVGSRMVKVEQGKITTPTPPVPPTFPNEPSVSLQLSELSDEFADLGTIEIPDIPVFNDIALVMPEGTLSRLPIRGVGDLISVDSIISARNNLPEAVRLPEDLRVFCSHEANDGECLKLLPLRLHDEAKMAIKESREEIARAIDERKKDMGAIGRDSDGDGITDFDEEKFFGTDPKKADTDGDGRSDEVELLREEHPLTPGEGVSQTVVFENPNLGGEERPEILAVVDLRVVETRETPEGKDDVKSIALSGRALPYAIVTIYIYSDPVIVRVKADESGLWSYTVTKELSDGSHKAYVAMTDSAGRVLAKSAPLPFVKQAAAISITPSLIPGVDAQAPGLLSGGSLYAFLLILAGVVGLAILGIGMVIRRPRGDDVVL